VGNLNPLFTLIGQLEENPLIRQHSSAKQKIPPLGGIFLPEPYNLLSTLLAGVLALTARILLLLSRLLAAALLLARLLTRVLVLLARGLVLIGHQDLLWLNPTRNNGRGRRWLRGNAVSGVLITRRRLVATVAAGTGTTN
jgi:hypothetical protein